MMKKAPIQIKGMNKDLGETVFNAQFAIENKNIRILSTNTNTSFSLCNEKGNRKIDITNLPNGLKGIPLGYSVLNNYIVLFTTSENFVYINTDISLVTLPSDVESTAQVIVNSNVNWEVLLENEDESNAEDTNIPTADSIYLLKYDNDSLIAEELYTGNLNFNAEAPIEAFSIYENENIQKVYWTDGINQPRVINIKETDKTNWNDTSFDFVRTFNSDIEISINKQIDGNGSFPAGVVQYAFSYFSLYGQETNLIYVSDLEYLSYRNRGGSAEDKISNVFNISISNLDPSYDYVRVYSIVRTSINGTPNVKVVTDLPITDSTDTLSVIDNNTIGYNVDPTLLLYIGGEVLSAYTMNHKDNTLFLGNIELKNKLFDETFTDIIKGLDVDFTYSNTKFIPLKEHTSTYDYNSQLDKSSQEIKIFKYLETYRLGLQFQHQTGKWSEPCWLGDYTNNLKIQGLTDDDGVKHGYIDGDKLQVATPKVSLPLNIIENLKNQGYTKVRPVIVYPTINDRTCICQGAVNPTVFNVEDRNNNAPFAQASWFYRPNAPFDLTNSSNDTRSRDGLNIDDLLTRNNSSKASVLNKSLTAHSSLKVLGDVMEFRHFYPIPDNISRNAEIQTQVDIESLPLSNNKSSTKLAFIDSNKSNFYIDQSIFTLHSPDIELDTEIQNLDLSNAKFRIIGIIPITANNSDIDIKISDSTRINEDAESSYLKKGYGFYSKPKKWNNTSRHGYKTAASGIYWMDLMTQFSMAGVDIWNTNVGTVVYPWHRNGALNDGKDEDTKTSTLKYKKLSNAKYSFNTYYLSTPWKASTHASGLADCKIFNSNEDSIIKLKAPSNSALDTILYKANIDKIITPNTTTTDVEGYSIIYGDDSVSIGTITSVNNLYLLEYSKTPNSTLNPNNNVTGIDSISMKYKTTPHAVLAFNYIQENNDSSNDPFIPIFPTLKETYVNNSTTTNFNINDLNEEDSAYYFWTDNALRIKQDTLNESFLDYKLNIYDEEGPEYGWLWLGELYREEVINRFGGDTQEALENNLWLPCGKAQKLNTDVIEFLEGDTYYQRYDNLKTYPYTLEDTNSIIDVLSFMCETRVNLDGRYDKNRGNNTSLAISPTNFNLLNEVYNQSNNYFNYRIPNFKKSSLNTFKNTVAWSLNKTNASEIDNWTSITLNNSLDLDGDKGILRSIQRLNNELIAFQDSGISSILFNSRTQLTSTEGVPIEIANSGRVDGKRYLTENVGCINKWSIVDSPMGLYFMDSLNKNIYLFNGQLNNLSDSLGFHSWSNNNITSEIWDIKNFNSFITHYDKINGDVLFTSKTSCLAFSEPLNAFTSFYSYENTPYFINFKNSIYTINQDYSSNTNYNYYLWKHHDGEYNMYFNQYQPFYIEFISNDNPTYDKIFDVLEFRADTLDSDNNLLPITFDTLKTYNEYQEGKAILIDEDNHKTRALEQKFRIWRVHIPRDKVKTRDRMRNPWLYLKLSMENPNTNYTKLHDLVVQYSI